MRLKEFRFTDSHWTLNPLKLGPINLLVGNNTTGKSRALALIDLAAKLISTSQQELFQPGEWSIILENQQKQSINYRFECEMQQLRPRIKSESISLGKDILGVFLRETNDGFYIARIKDQNEKSNSVWEIFEPPVDRLMPAIQIVQPEPEGQRLMRTEKDYSFLKNIMQWAKSTYSFAFANTGPNSLRAGHRINGSTERFPIRFSELSQDDRAVILEEVKLIGFNLDKLWVEERGDGPVLIMKEKGVDNEIIHDNFSQGLSRALSLIIFLQQLVSQNTFATLLIDDLCEGMDFDRARKLGKLVFEKCAKNNIQLIATSNDSFLMDVIDLDYLTILRREGSVIHSINRATNREIFDEFEMTGFSNFDLYSSSFLAQHNL